MGLHLVGLFTRDDIDDVSRAETLPGAVDGGQYFLRGFRAVEHVGRRQADIAIAAIFAERLAEIGEQRTATALGDLAPAQQRIELGAFAALVRVAGRGRVHHLPQAHDVLQSVDHPGNRR